MSEFQTVLAGDIGGTKTNLALFAFDGASAKMIASKREATSDFASVEEMIGGFLAGEAEAQVAAAAFGAAGPVEGNICRTLKVDWVVDGAAIAKSTGIERVTVVNDLVAMGFGIAFLKGSDLLTLQEGVELREANAVVLAAGTGLGETTLFYDGSGRVPSASEGGHADFAPRTETEIELLSFLAARYGHVSYDRLLSGEGLRNIYEFLSLKGGTARGAALSSYEADAPRAVTEAAASGSDPVATEALSLFVSIYGAEAGNAALRAMARGGVYIGGGIAPKIIDALKGGAFMDAFRAKGRHAEMMKDFPVRVILNEAVPLLGAASVALKSMGVSEIDFIS